mmetsp:Transcript_46115/g.61064  ORF Transcript_46115/g.61064 Transcript_46115/m.61064 type:complete len:110 (-) Transcript_46115:863-1192(-)
MGIISFEQERPASQPDLANDAHYVKEDTARLRDFETLELSNQVTNARRQLSKTPDASQEKNFNAILFNQSFSADLELLNNAPSAQLPAFDEEPIAVDPNFSEPIESDDE